MEQDKMSKPIRCGSGPGGRHPPRLLGAGLGGDVVGSDLAGAPRAPPAVVAWFAARRVGMRGGPRALGRNPCDACVFDFAAAVATGSA